MAFVAGQTFLYPIDNPTATPHLWVIATPPDTDGFFVVVNFTSLKGSKDQTMIIRAGEHPFVRWDTAVNYALAEITDGASLEAKLASGAAELRQPLSTHLLDDVAAGLTASGFTRNRVRSYAQRSRTARP